MKECPSCGRMHDNAKRFCPMDGTQLVESVQNSGDLDSAGRRRIPQPLHPLPMRLTIVDQGDDGRRSRVIQGLVHDVSHQGMRVETGTVETGHLNIVRDHTIAFKNRIEVEVDLPHGTVRFTGFAAWYKPSADGINWMVGVYIRDMSAANRQAYDRYLDELSGRGDVATAPV